MCGKYSMDGDTKRTKYEPEYRTRENKSIDMKAKMHLLLFCYSFISFVCVCYSNLYCICRFFTSFYFCLLSIVFPLLHAYCGIVHIIKIHLYYIFKINILCAYEMGRRKYKRASIQFFFRLFFSPREMKEGKKN